MRAVVYDRYGPPEVLRLEDVDRPVPGDDQVLVRIHATTVNRTDCGFRSAEFFVSRFFTGVVRPRQRIPGMEFAGVVEAAGAAVTEFGVGDRVFGVTGAGAHAEFTCIRESSPVAHMPAGMSFEEAAAACDGASLALACLRKAGSLDGKSVLVYGASGAVGTAAVQLAQALRRPRHGRVQHEDRRARPIARRRRGDRLHARRLHEERQDVRRRLRRGRQALVPALPPLAEAGRDLHGHRPRIHVARLRRWPS